MDEWDILNAKMDAKKGMDEWDILNAKMDANPRVQSPATPKQPSPKPRLSLLEKALDLLMRPTYAGAEALSSLTKQEGAAPDWLQGLKEGFQGKRRQTYVDVFNKPMPALGFTPKENVVNIPEIPDLPSQIPFIGGGKLRESISGPFDVNTLIRSLVGEVAGAQLYPIPGGGAVRKFVEKLPGGIKALQAGEAGIKAVSEAPGIKQTLQLLNTRIGLPKTYAEAREVYKDLKDLKKWEQLEQTRKEVKVLPKLPEREAAATRIEAGRPLTPAEQQFADLMKIKSEEMGKEESMRGLLSAQRTGYIAHLEEPPKKAGLPGLLGQREESAFAGGRTSGAGEEGLIGPAKWEIERKLQTIADYDRFYWVRDPKHERGWRAIEKKPGQAIPEDAVTIQAITDPARAMGIRGQSYVQRTLAHDFLYGTPEGSVFPKQTGILNQRDIAIPTTLKEEFGPKGQVRDWRNWERIVPDNRFPDKAYFVPKDVKNDLLQTVKTMSDPRGSAAMFDTIGKAFDLPTNVWKLWATAQNPGFHFRNMLGNFFNQYLAGVTDFNQTTKLGMNFWKPLKFEAKQGSFIVTKSGRRIPGSDVIRWGNENGVIKREFLYGEFNPALEKEIQKATSGGLPAVGEVGKGFGQAVETQARLNLFIDGLRKNMTPFNAAMRVKKYLFDYGDLTAPERQLMRRVFPFYTWARKNIPLQFEHLITHSDKYQKLATVIDSWKSAAGGVSEEEQKLQPEYFRDLAAFKTPLGSKEVPLYFNPNLPMQDINIQPLRDMLSRLNPLAKVPIELATNKNAYFDRELARGLTEEEKKNPALISVGWWGAGRKVAPSFPGVEKIPDWAKAKLGIIRGRTKQSGPERWVVPPRVNYLLSQIPFLANVGKARPEVADEYTPWQTLSFLAGIKLIPLDIEKQRQWKQIDERKDQLEQAKRRGLEAR